ncbi:MAG: M15 family metallopeptidase [Cytophagaceae bacterium]
MLKAPIFLLLLFVATAYQQTSLRDIKEENKDTIFVKLEDLSPDFAYDMRYATENNFLKQKVYECASCVLREEVGRALVKINKAFLQKGYRIKLYDCYRPLDVQKKMWEIYPNANYVANPHTRGSVHNRGGAVDITLVDLKGVELDMGTDFDHFGKEAHHSYTELSEKVIKNRALLKETMEAHGFASLRTEWWHYSFKSKHTYSLSNFMPQCE